MDLAEGQPISLPNPPASPEVVAPESELTDIDSEADLSEAGSAIADNLPPEDLETEEPDRRWYLGLDFGSVGISAVLLDRETSQTYLIQWQGSSPDGRAAPLLRLPAIAYLAAEQLDEEPTTPLAVGELALKAKTVLADHPNQGLLLSNLRQILNVAVPYIPDARQTWEPVVQWSDQQPIFLEWVRQSAIALLATLKGNSSEPSLCLVEGLSPNELEQAIANLAGVVIGCPTGWSDAYQFNLREVVLEAGLVERAAQIFFIEDAIAALLSELPAISDSPMAITSTPTSGTGRNARSLLAGSTLVLNAGAILTELLLVNLPEDAQTLSREDLYLRSIAYGGNSIDQDIICQLLYPSAWGWRNLGSPTLDLPLPGEPDLPTRHRFQQRLRANELGQTLLRGAKQIKLSLAQSETTVFSLGDRQWTVTQQDFHSRVIAPYIQGINREINTLLAQTGILVHGVRQVLITGGAASTSAIAQWLQQKFPNAALIQDPTHAVAFSSRIAIGLAKLPLYPQLADATHHRYSNYFLLRELLQMMPNEPLPIGRILQLLAAQEIDSEACQSTVLKMLEGQLPSGLIPAKADMAMLTLASRQNHDYQGSNMARLFYRQSNQVYGLDQEIGDRLWNYLEALLSNTHQTLEEPLSFELETQIPI